MAHFDQVNACIMRWRGVKSDTDWRRQFQVNVKNSIHNGKEYHAGGEGNPTPFTRKRSGVRAPHHPPFRYLLTVEIHGEFFVTLPIKSRSIRQNQ